MSPAPAFHLFPQLPTELRLAIWKFCCTPRVVEVWYDSVADRCRTTSRPPAVLHVNREARDEALRQAWYRRCFATGSRPEHGIYFSPALDVLYLPRHGLLGYDDTAREFTVHVRDTAEHVRALAIDHVRTDTIRPWEPYNKLMLIFSFPNVQETMLVVGADSGGGDRWPARRRSQESLETSSSAASSSSSSSSTSLASLASLASATASAASTLAVPGKPADIELVDPQGDTAKIMDLIDNVIESFSREIQAAGGGGGLADFTDPEHGPLLDKDDDDNTTRVFPHIPSLIPKAKAYPYQRRRRPRRKRAIGCA